MNKQESGRLGGIKSGQISAAKWKEKENKYLLNPNKCIECSCDLDWKRKNYKFCSNSCAAKSTNRNRIDRCPNRFATKLCKCRELTCSTIVEVNIRHSSKTVLCKKCKESIKTKNKKLNKKSCKLCGSLSCTNDICKRPQLVRMLLQFGLNPKTLGCIEFLKEFERIKLIVQSLYFDDGFSGSDIAEIYGMSRTNTISKLKYFGIKSRTLSECARNSIVKGKLVPPTNSQYKTGWHTTWTGSQIFYRSSYELEYAIQLDVQRINYEVEELRIEYWDSQRMKYRIAIPDFHLNDSNTIVEIKSNWTYDSINMIDKFQTYQELGYKFKLILEKIEYSEPVLT